MSAIFNFIERFFRLFVWWVVVEPWEQAIRVRLGKAIVLLEGGLHFRIPCADVIYRQSVRLRVVGLPAQTLTTNDGKTLFVAGNIGYCLRDIRMLYSKLHHAEDTLKYKAQTAIAQYVYTHAATECTPNQVIAGTIQVLNFDEYGLGSLQLFLTDFAMVPKTFRVIMNADQYTVGDKLEMRCTEPSLAPPR